MKRILSHSLVLSLCLLLSMAVGGCVFSAPNQSSLSQETPNPGAPSGFIAVSNKDMNWNDAKAWCQQRGGRSPLIDGKNSIPSQPNPGTPVDGFGSTGEKWSSGLPYSDITDVYWTGTEVNNLGLPWVIVGRGGGDALVYVDHARQGGIYRVVCVPCAK